MTDRPIIFSAPMVRALLDGRKTQTRRIAKFVDPQDNGLFHLRNAYGGALNCTEEEVRREGPDYAPHAIGDRLWVRESGATIMHADDHDPRARKDIWYVHGWKHSADGAIIGYAGNRPSNYLGDCSLTSRPSIHMPRWASRLTLVVTDVRVERLQEITGDDATDEGIIPFGERHGFKLYTLENDDRHGTAVSTFAELWRKIHGQDAWYQNPWVAAYAFEVHHCNIDAMEAA